MAVKPTYLDVTLEAGAPFAADLASGDTAFAYVFEGSVVIGAPGEERTVSRGELAVLGNGDSTRAAGGPQGGRFLLIAGRPIGEPVARYGPIVMNTRAELTQASTTSETVASSNRHLC